MASKGLQTGIQVLLWVIIAGLSYVLYYSITKPYEAVERRAELTVLTRERMDQIRQLAIHYETHHDRYPSTLDSLLMYGRQDSLFLAQKDSLFGPGFVVDSLMYSPRDGRKPFIYAATDTTKVRTYLLEDPDSNDSIGTLASDITLVNAASWE